MKSYRLLQISIIGGQLCIVMHCLPPHFALCIYLQIPRLISEAFPNFSCVLFRHIGICAITLPRTCKRSQETLGYRNYVSSCPSIRKQFSSYPNSNESSPSKHQTETASFPDFSYQLFDLPETTC
jgi:hypothetical protein